MTFHEFKRAMSVMDGDKCVATAKLTARKGMWMLTIRNACWTDPRARTQGLIPGKYPDLMLVNDRREARRHMRLLAGIDRKARAA